jgi:hypothetical protein
MPGTEPVLADRPQPKRAALRQRWAELAYLHWPCDPDIVPRLLPDAVRVDTFDDAAWVGLIPCAMRNVRLGPTPREPCLAAVVEINVRTYIVDPLGLRSVWFFSLDVPWSVIVARTVVALLYCWSRTEYDADGVHRRYAFDRVWLRRTNASAEIEFAIGDAVDHAADLDHFLTARWTLLTRRLLPAPESSRGGGLPSPHGTPRTACCPGVDVEVGWLGRIRS